LLGKEDWKRREREEAAEDTNGPHHRRHHQSGSTKKGGSHKRQATLEGQIPTFGVYLCACMISVDFLVVRVR